MKLSEKIRILRKARGLSQEELGFELNNASDFGVSRQSISDWENGIFYSDKDNNYRIISKHDYNILRDQIKEVLCLDGLGGEEDYNPADDKAREIAEKLKARKKRLAKDKGKKNKISCSEIIDFSYNALKEVLDNK